MGGYVYTHTGIQESKKKKNVSSIIKYVRSVKGAQNRVPLNLTEWGK